MQIDQKLLAELHQIAKRASEQILKIYDTTFTVNNKEDSSPVTAADIAAHKVICKSLSKLTPDIPILSEESEAISYTERRNWTCYWLVDPLDGTREFIKRNDEFTVNIALIENHQTKIGVVYIPVTGICYYATHSLGAFKIGADGNTQAIKTKKSTAEHIVLARSRSHEKMKQQLLTKLLNATKINTEIITMGSSLKFCLIAEGKADIYPRFGPTSEWDTAAAQCIVEVAGGQVTDMQFKPLRYNTKTSLINPDFLAIADKSFHWDQILTPDIKQKILSTPNT